MNGSLRCWRRSSRRVTNRTSSEDRPEGGFLDVVDEATLLASAKRGDRDALQRLTERHRKELQVHCYRMLGSFHDAEDLVQETFLRAWRGLGRFEQRASVRQWLYRIATNACLNALARRGSARRVLPEAYSPPSDHMPGSEPVDDVAWLEPYPDSALEGIDDAARGPEARYESRESVQLAFIAAIQHLPPRQRAALLLHDVMGWSAQEAAQLLGASVASVNSALQRARTTLEKRLPAGRRSVVAEPTDKQRVILERYVRAWESADPAGFVDVLREDAVLSMPPWQQWYLGPQAIRTFLAWTSRPGGQGPFRLVPTGANRQPAFAFYSQWQGPEWRSHSLQVITLQADSIAAMTSFVSPALFSAFGLPAVLPAQLPG